MNISLKSSSGRLTVKELRSFLEDHESKWTDQDVEYLGKFEDQKILSLPPRSGYTFSKIEEALGCGGFFIIPTDEKGEIINE